MKKLFIVLLTFLNSTFPIEAMETPLRSSRRLSFDDEIDWGNMFSSVERPNEGVLIRNMIAKMESLRGDREWSSDVPAEALEQNLLTAAMIKQYGLNFVAFINIQTQPIHEIESHTWNRNEYLECIILPTDCRVLGRGAFHLCTHLKRVVLPTALESTGIGAFDDCKILKGWVIIPASTYTIAKKLFRHCEKLTVYFVPRTQQQKLRIQLVKVHTVFQAPEVPWCSCKQVFFGGGASFSYEEVEPDSRWLEMTWKYE